MRFLIMKNTPGSWYVYDTDKGILPQPPVVLYMRKEAAQQICDIMNSEWSHFLRHPS